MENMELILAYVIWGRHKPKESFQQAKFQDDTDSFKMSHFLMGWICAHKRV